MIHELGCLNASHSIFICEQIVFSADNSKNKLQEQINRQSIFFLVGSFFISFFLFLSFFIFYFFLLSEYANTIHNIFFARFPQPVRKYTYEILDGVIHFVFFDHPK